MWQYVLIRKSRRLVMDAIRSTKSHKTYYKNNLSTTKKTKNKANSLKQKKPANQNIPDQTDWIVYSASWG
jgi:hypothetical protein